MTLFIFSEYYRRIIQKPITKTILITVILAIGLFATVKNAGTYANNIRNINECDVAAGVYLGSIAKPGDIAAVNDIGAIGYYSNMEIFDLWGLASPEMTRDMILNDSLAFEYMKTNKKINYMAIFPKWFKYLSGRDDIFKPLIILETENNTVLAEERTIVYKAFWQDTTNQNYPESQ